MREIENNFQLSPFKKWAKEHFGLMKYYQWAKPPNAMFHDFIYMPDEDIKDIYPQHWEAFIEETK